MITVKTAWILIIGVHAHSTDGRPQHEVQIGPVKLELVASFCYFGDMLSAGRGCELEVTTCVKTAWKKFRELLPVLTSPPPICTTIHRGSWVLMFYHAPPPPPPIRREGNILFLVRILLTLALGIHVASFLCIILWTSGWILTQLADTLLGGQKELIRFGDRNLIIKVTAALWKSKLGFPCVILWTSYRFLPNWHRYIFGRVERID